MMEAETKPLIAVVGTNMAARIELKEKVVSNFNYLKREDS